MTRPTTDPRGNHRRAGVDADRLRAHRRLAATALLACACLVAGLIAGNAGPHPQTLQAADASKVSAAAPGDTGTLDASTPDDTGTTVPGGTTSTTDPAPTTTTPGPTTTTTVPDDPTVAAPPGYADQLTSLYGEIYVAATSVQVPDQSQQVMTPDSFDQQVSGLSQSDLSMIYTATSNIPNFDSLTTTFKQADVVAARAARILKLKKPTPVEGLAKVERSAATVIKRVSLFGVTVPLLAPQALTNFTPSVVPVIYPDVSCPNGAPGIDYGETAIFSLQVATDVISEAVAVIPDGLSTAFGNATIPNIGRLIVAAIQLGVVITHDTFAYLQAVSNDCAGNYLASLAGNTDNTAFQTFTELTQVAGTANEIDTNVANLTNQDTNQFDQQLTLSIQQALAAPAGTVPMAAMELPASAGGYLDGSPVGVNQVVSATIRAMQTTGQPLSAHATRDETLGEQANASGQYKLAFAYYRLAYQAAAS